MSGEQEVIQLELRHVIGAQESSRDDDDLRFSLEGWLRFRALMAQCSVRLIFVSART